MDPFRDRRDKFDRQFNRIMGLAVFFNILLIVAVVVIVVVVVNALT